MALITISRNQGSGGEAVARLVSEGLNLELFDDQKLQEKALQLGIQSDELKRFNEKAPGLFDRIWSSKLDLYLDIMEAVVCEVARKGDGVIVGHGSPLLLRDFECALHVLIHAPEPVRSRNMIERNGLSLEAATKLVRQSDQERQGFLKFAYHMDWNDLSLFDLVINTEKLDLEGAARFIMHVARSEQIRACSLGALEAMERRSLTKKVQSALRMKNFNLTSLHIEVDEKGVVFISGMTEAKRLQPQLVELVKAVPGVKEVRTDLAAFIKL